MGIDVVVPKAVDRSAAILEAEYPDGALDTVIVLAAYDVWVEPE